MFKKILIANRGEIAVRVMRTCRRLGIRTVAVFSEADREAMHVRMADEAYCIGPARPDLSYLNIPNILSVAHATKCEGIHPGYGFLSENPNFAEIATKCGFVFIGPSHRAMERMGQKSVARDLMIRSGVPVLPGSQGSIEDPQEGLRLAREIGFPVLVKASAGGGGRGMRLVETEDQFVSLFNMARAEAQSAFGDGRVYIEKFLRTPRHIEVQIMGDTHGTVLAFGERECSIQRRHQKLIEESPSPAVDETLRQQFFATAVQAAKAIDYVNAGTIEFLLDENGKFFFMEMNTRLQVEHPVTELVCGYDLVEWQLRVASGEPLPMRQDELKPHGWAVECRINAEDVTNGFSPSPGRIETYHVPGGPWVRVDSAAYPGYVVSPNYDSMVAKLIVWAPTRLEALDRMRAALTEYRIRGIRTTIPFHTCVMQHPDFRNGEFSTRFVDRNLETILREIRETESRDTAGVHAS
ncbi:MAG TPA: acetyl-CoA carboxylase biotin carboxylase subunit [Candidatus Ozemobacteraceae bacterium]|mgnify:CR=1 FL=1|nr:acetyl-CoA carboxylase biotin carboxylase subunit [Candidatus Ozemobacteraceae bacterium]